MATTRLSQYGVNVREPRHPFVCLPWFAADESDPCVSMCRGRPQFAAEPHWRAGLGLAQQYAQLVAARREGAIMKRFHEVVCALALGLAACGSSDGGPPKPDCPAGTLNCRPPESPSAPGAVVKLSLSAADQAELDALEAELAPLSAATADSLLSEHSVTFSDDLGYDPKTAKGMELIQSTPLALDAAELDKLGEHGFAISKRQTFANMAYGLKTIYANDLPVYISLDAILDAVHGSYNAILKRVETEVLTRDLHTLLTSARTRNASAPAAQTRKDLDFYFSVALGLLDAKPVAPVAGADAAAINDAVAKATAASGIQEITLFGVPRKVDFSQFTPRGHYADTMELTQYFRAMMWLGRTDFRLIETKSNGERVFHRRQLEAVLALRDTVKDDAADAFERIDAVVTAFVGDHDYMQLEEVDALLTDLGASTSSDVAKLSDEKIAQTIIEKGYGAQQIASQVIFKDPSALTETFPLDRSFALLGQRYVVDSHVFSDVVYDRVVPPPGKQLRVLPDPLDAAYAALGNSAALPLLREQLERYGYAPQLERVRALIDAHDAEFWDGNLYNIWLSALRVASQRPAADAAVPKVTRTEAWSRRILNTQLGSWAQLRHDTILYAKQSYTAGILCEFPDAYVDPYPEAFARVAAFATHGKKIATLLGSTQSSELVTRMNEYFDELASVSNILRDMAEQQQKGVPFNAAQMAFVNDAVKTGMGVCGGPTPYQGWYARLLFTRDDSEMKPIIADVHTDPGGDRPPKVLHVATGLPRFMVVTVDTCMGPRAYAGVSFAYHEVIPAGLKRLNDMEWRQMAMSAPNVPWMAPLLD